MALADSKQWRVHVSTNLPPLDVEVADGGFKNQGMVVKLETFAVPGGLETYETRCFWGDTAPNATDYPDAYAPIGSMFYRLIVTAGVVTGAECYVKNAAGAWVLYTPPAVIAAAKTAAYDVLTSDELILLDSSGGVFQVDLPAVATMTGKRLVFKMVGTGTNAVTVEGDGAETIDGATSNADMDAQYDVLEIQSDGSAWHILNQISN